MHSKKDGQLMTKKSLKLTNYKFKSSKNIKNYICEFTKVNWRNILQLNWDTLLNTLDNVKYKNLTSYKRSMKRLIALRLLLITLRRKSNANGKMQMISRFNSSNKSWKKDKILKCKLWLKDKRHKCKTAQDFKTQNTKSYTEDTKLPLWTLSLIKELKGD